MCTLTQVPIFQINRIRIQTTTPQTLEGTVFTICPVTSLLAICATSTPTPPTNPPTTTPAPPTTKTHIIPLSALTSFTLLPSTTPVQPPPVTPLKPSTLLARANAALNLAKEKAARINKDVSKETQEIFDALYKQFPGTRWAGKDMVVLDAVLIKGPGYRTEDCKAGKGGEGAVGRVKKVVSLVLPLFTLFTLFAEDAAFALLDWWWFG